MLCAVTDRLLHRHRPIADLAPGEHACLLYDDPEEQFALVAPYIRQGLMREDHCVYVAADRTIDDVRRLLGDVGIDVEQQIANGRLVLLSPDRFRQPGDFDPAIMRAFLRGMVEQSVAAGFNGVRLAVEMAWALQTGVPVERLVEFESDLNATLFPAVRISAICQYDRRGYPARTLVGALRSHPLLVVGHEVFANVCHEPPALRGAADSDRLDWMLAQVDRARAGESRQAEQALRQSEERLQAILDNSTAVISLKDRQGRYLLVNRRFEELFHTERGAILGLTPADMFPAAHAEAFRVNDGRVLEAGKPLEFEEAVPQDDGIHTYLSIKFPLFDDAGLPAAVCTISTDITERKRAEHQLHAARSEAEAANRAKDEFLATLSHELRTPLNAMLGWVRMLRMRQAGEEQQAHGLEVIERNTQLLRTLIDDLLDVSRIIAGKLQLSPESVELAPVVEAAVDSLRQDAESKPLRLTATIEMPAPAVWGDRLRLQQVVSNLLSNAVKFTPSGGAVDVGLARVHDMARITVRDTGEGIDPAALPRIFDRFRQADSANARQQGGLGLGLAIVQHLVQLHGGTVRAESAGRGQGALFTVELPIQRGTPGHARPC